MIKNLCNGPISLENPDSYREEASRRAPPPQPSTASSRQEQLRHVGKTTSKCFVIQQPLEVPGLPDISPGGLKTKPASRGRVQQAGE